MKTILRLGLAATVVIMTCLLAARPAGAESSHQVVVLTVDGALSPVIVNYIERGIGAAQAQGAAALIIRLNTPGGEIVLMDKIVSAILDSRVPVIVYVSPSGGIAGSAGTVITLAAQLNAMAPNTSIGAASPIDASGQNIGGTLETKIKNVLEAQVRNLAGGRPPAAIALAQATIEKATAATAGEAQAVGLTDILAADLPDLLRQLDGRTVKVQGQPVILQTANAAVVELQINLLEQILGILTNANIIFLLFALGAQAILVEVTHPGGWAPGFFGVVCLALAFYGLGVLPVNWFGLAFMVLSFALFVLDLKAASHGALTLAAVASLIVGTLVLFNSPGSTPNLQVSVPLVMATSVIIGGLSFGLVLIALRTRHLPPANGPQILVGRTGVVTQALSPSGVVRVGGEEWSAETNGELIEAGQTIQVSAVQGVKLRVHQA
jgi:membrane-bound serine protease (ClpP class)